MKAQAWFFYGSASFLVTLCSAWALLPDWSPSFDYTNPDFKAFRFHRTWRHVFCIGSQDFARDLERAILLAKSGSFKQLEDILEDPRMALHVVQICHVNGLDSDTEESSEGSLEPLAQSDSNGRSGAESQSSEHEKDFSRFRSDQVTLRLQRPKAWP